MTQTGRRSGRRQRDEIPRKNRARNVTKGFPARGADPGRLGSAQPLPAPRTAAEQARNAYETGQERREPNIPAVIGRERMVGSDHSTGSGEWQRNGQGTGTQRPRTLVPWRSVRAVGLLRGRSPGELVTNCSLVDGMPINAPFAPLANRHGAGREQARNRPAALPHPFPCRVRVGPVVPLFHAGLSIRPLPHLKDSGRGGQILETGERTGFHATPFHARG